MSNRFTKYTADKLRLDGWLDKEQADHLRTQLKSVEAERDEATERAKSFEGSFNSCPQSNATLEADAAVMREACIKSDEALEWSDPSKGTCCGSTSQEDCRAMYEGARESLEKALSTNAGKSLLLRLQEAEWLLSNCERSTNYEWNQRRDTFLNPTTESQRVM